MTTAAKKIAHVFVDTPEDRIKIEMIYSGDFIELVKELMRAGVFAPSDSERRSKISGYLERGKYWFPPSAIYKVSDGGDRCGARAKMQVPVCIGYGLVDAEPTKKVDTNEGT